MALGRYGAGHHTMEGLNVYDLAKFSNIRDLSWIGPLSEGDFDAIRDCLVTNVRHMEVPNPETIDWSKADEF
jgi:hypothetical protein